MNDKKFKVLILVNTLQSVPSFVYANHIDFATYNTKTFPNATFYFMTPHRTTIDNARNSAAVQALALECDYLMFLDDDVLIPKNAFEKMFNADKDIIAGLVYLRGFPFQVMAFEEKETEEKKNLTLGYFPNEKVTQAKELTKTSQDINDSLVRCDAIGFSCALIKMSIFKALPPPFFVTGMHNTEDVYFCLKTRELEPRPEVWLHTDIECGHLLNPEPIEFQTRHLQVQYCEGLQKMFKELQGEEVTTAEDQMNPRNLEYLLRNVKAL